MCSILSPDVPRTFSNSWCDPFKTWQYAYSFDPLANLTSDQYSQIMGGASCLLYRCASPDIARIVQANS